LSFQEKMIAAKAIGSKNYPAAIKSCKRMLSENEEDYFAIAMLAYCYEWGGAIANSIIYADKYLARFPNDLDMLLLSARYWATSGDEERSYNFVCRAMKNRTETPAEIPNWLFWLLKPFSILKKYRGIETKAKEGVQIDTQWKADNLEWARQYKIWYESKLETEDK
jgi:hypothetical protein